MFVPFNLVRGYHLSNVTLHFALFPFYCSPDTFPSLTSQWTPLLFDGQYQCMGWSFCQELPSHYSEVIINKMATLITTILILYSTVCSGTDQRKCQIFMVLAFVRGLHWWPVKSPHKRPVMQKMFPFDVVIINNSFKEGIFKQIFKQIIWFWFFDFQIYSTDMISTDLDICWRALVITSKWNEWYINRWCLYPCFGWLLLTLLLRITIKIKSC